MPQSIQVNANVDGQWPDATLDKVTVATGIRIGGIRHGTVSGKSAVAILLEFEDGTFGYADVTMAAFQTAARALAVAHEGAF